MQKIAFIGLGNMGAPMAGNLVKAGFSLTGYDPVPAAREDAAGRGLMLAESAVAAVRGAEAVITMLPSGALVREVWQQIAPHIADGALVIDCSTIDVGSARAAHELLSPRCDTLDAPVSGGTGGAEAGTLTFMIGGSDTAFARARPLLEPMAGRLVHCGAAGTGQAAKLCNNMILGISMVAVSEAFVLAEKLGLDSQALFDVASTSSGQCWSLNTYCPVPGPVPASPANRDYKPGFATELMLKDLTLAQEAAGSSGAATPLGQHAAALYSAFSAGGGSGQDFSAIVTWLREQTREG